MEMTGKMPRIDPDTIDNRIHDEKGMVLRKRSEVRSDEEVVEVVRHRGQVLPRRPGARPGAVRSTSSMDDVRDDGRYRRNRGPSGSDSYDSEGSVPPRNRVRPRSENGRRRGGNSSTSSDTSSIGSSTDEQKQCRKMRRKKWITAALASVATIHAASKVYSSIENHDKRIIQVEKGELSPDEARKKQRSARWQDAAAIGIAALGIKGAISEWKEVKEEHGEHLEMIKKQEEHHKKRLERARRMKAREETGYYKGRDGNWYYDGPERQYSDQRRDVRAIDGPRHGSQFLLENGNGGERSRSVYGRDKSRSRSEYAYSRDRSSDDDRYRDRSRRRRNDDDY